MTNEEMVKKAESMTVKAYNPKVLRKAIDDGFDAIDDGCRVGTSSDGRMVIVKFADHIDCIKADDGTLLKSSPVTDAAKDQVVIMYAIKMAEAAI